MPLVELTYRPCFSQEEYTQVFTRASADSKTYDFVEGLVYSKDKAVIMTGKMKPYSALMKKPFSFNPIGYWWKPWFYLHVKSFLGKSAISDVPDSQVSADYTELLPLRDYYHRHTRSIFWELKDIIPFSDHWLFRLLLGWMTPPRISIIKLGQTDAIREAYGSKHVAQDMLVPISTLTESMNCMDKEFSTYPLWLCPMLLPALPATSPGARALVRSRLPIEGNTLPEQMFVDIGAYGAPPIPNFDARHALRQAERFVLHEAQGYQALYADSLLTRQEFRQMFDHSLYDEVRAKYNMDESFPEIYDKVSLSARK